MDEQSEMPPYLWGSHCKTMLVADEENSESDKFVLIPEKNKDFYCKGLHYLMFHNYTWADCVLRFLGSCWGSCFAAELTVSAITLNFILSVCLASTMAG